MHLPLSPDAIAFGALGVLWLLGLWLAAPVLGSARNATQQLALAIALGCLIPLCLGLLNLLYWWSLWVALLALLAVRLSRRTRRVDRDEDQTWPWDAVIGFAALLALAWPTAVRPVMDGDTLIYHLPNAASWVAQHGVWATGTRYWWYPPASELFASGLFATGGIGVVGWAGLMPPVLLLLIARRVARRAGVAPFAGTLLACALLATPVAAVQIVSLQNDVWLTALFLFALTEYLPPIFGVLALTKPYGWLLSATASSVWASDRKQLIKALAFSGGALALWIVRDLILMPHAAVPIATTRILDVVDTTLASHLPGSLATLAKASWNAGIVWCLFLACGIASAFLSPNRQLRWAAVISICLFAIIPTGYGIASAEQLATGESLRFALPIAGLGLTWMVSSLQRATPLVAVVAGIGTIAGVATQWQISYNDATTRDAPIVVIVATLVAVGSLLLRDGRGRTVVLSCLCLLLGALAAGLADSHPADYVADVYGGAFAFAASQHFERIITLGLPAGAAITVDPKVNAFDGMDWGTCVEAQALGAIVITKIVNLPRADCGRIVYRDGTTVVLDSGPHSTQ